jgi:hypothetical protein
MFLICPLKSGCIGALGKGDFFFGEWAEFESIKVAEN